MMSGCSQSERREEKSKNRVILKKKEKEDTVFTDVLAAEGCTVTDAATKPVHVPREEGSIYDEHYKAGDKTDHEKPEKLIINILENIKLDRTRKGKK